MEVNLSLIGSNLILQVDVTDTSILGNLLTLTAKKGLTPSLTANNSYTISFNNAIYNPSTTYEGAVTTSTFAYTDAAGTTYSTSYLDDLNGVMRVFYYSGSEKVIVANNIGTVAYSNGHITLTSFKPDSFSGSTLDFTIKGYLYPNIKGKGFGDGSDNVPTGLIRTSIINFHILPYRDPDSIDIDRIILESDTGFGKGRDELLNEDNSKSKNNPYLIAVEKVIEALPLYLYPCSKK